MTEKAVQKMMPDSKAGICSHCGRPLPPEAAFCPWCENQQITPREIVPPRASQGKGAVLCFLLLICAIALASVFLLWRRTAPREYRGGVFADYMLNGEKCRLVLSFREELEPDEEPMAVFKDEQPDGMYAAAFSRLFLFSETGNALQERFMESIKDFHVTAVPRDSIRSVQIMESELTGEENGQIGFTHIVYGPENGTNDICWDLTMKNGDTIHLEHTVTCDRLPTMEIHFEETPLNTIAQIEAALEGVMEAGYPKTVPVLYLPPVEYEGTLTLDTCSARLIGSAEGEKRTTFTDTVTVKTRSPIVADIQNISFEGQGGTGLAAEEGVLVTDCSFRGFDVGADAREGSWIILFGCRFEKNGTGFRFDSGRSTCSSTQYSGLWFTGNDVGIEIRRVPGNLPLELTDCVFEDNGTDVVDPKGLVSGY